MIKVLFLSAWYPNRYDAMLGLFVRKHAEAVSLYCDVTVLYVHADKQIKHFDIIHQHLNENAREVIIYYPERSKGLFRKLIKTFNYFKANYIGYKEVSRTTGKPNITHVNILTRTGVIGYLIKTIDKVPYVVTEHWSRYLKNRNTYSGFIRKSLTKLVVKNASGVLPVSKGLGEAMIYHKLYNAHYETVNNVVDDFFFTPIITQKSNKKRILHVSCFDELAKNIYGILRAVKQLSLQRNDFELILVGNGINYVDTTNYAKSLMFNDEIIHFIGELSPQDVAIQFQQADFFVMFSNYENSPVVISESLSCGKPVLSSDVGGVSEHINHTNGILIPSKDENALTEKLNYMLDHYKEFDSEAIQKKALQDYSYKNVGYQIYSIYKRILDEIQ